jgi:SAM-dependent methyltransferase
MRDPLGSITITPRGVERTLTQPLPVDHLLHNQCAVDLVQSGQLIPFEFQGEYKITSLLIPFVTYPHEWCNAQFVDAANLTLEISEKIFPHNYELKDASAWNVIFQGNTPVFCDHLSFQKIQSRQWWAFGQFVRHFILPLCIRKHRGFDAKNAFKINHDGLAPGSARNLMGLSRFGTRYWPLMFEPRPQQKTTNPHTVEVKSGQDSLHKNLYVITRWFLGGVSCLRHRSSSWIDYVDERDHYSEEASIQKFNTVKGWLEEIKPQWVTDLGCNTGEYSKLAVDCGAQVIAIDLDHESIQKLYLSEKARPIYTVLANLDDLPNGRGWAGQEFPGLLQRLEQRSEVVLMLALIHHLSISSAIPLEKIVDLTEKLTKHYLIVEHVSDKDPLVQHLAGQRARLATDFSIAKQSAAFERKYRVIQKMDFDNQTRQLVLYKKINV